MSSRRLIITMSFHGTPHHGCAVPPARGLQLRVHHRQLVGRMLGVEQQPVEARAGHHLDRDVARRGCTTGRSAAVPALSARLNGLVGSSIAHLSGSRARASAPAPLEEIEVAALVGLRDVLLRRARRSRARMRRAAAVHAARRRGELGVARPSSSRRARRDVELDHVAVAHQRERPADVRLGRDVQHAGAVARAAHARVRDAHHVAHALLRAASSGSAAGPIPACPARRAARRSAARAPSPRRRRASGSSMRAAMSL